jgi:hypothetical protein
MNLKKAFFGFYGQLLLKIMDYARWTYDRDVRGSITSTIVDRRASEKA